MCSTGLAGGADTSILPLPAQHAISNTGGQGITECRSCLAEAAIRRYGDEKFTEVEEIKEGVLV